jgi:hypothetical protein
MRPRVESWIWIALCALASTAGCAGDASFRPGATDVPPPSTPPEQSPPAHKAERWEHFPKLQSMTLHAAEFASRGHGTGDWNAQVRVNATALEALPALGVGRSLPRGSVLVQLHTDKRTGAPVHGFAMEKREEGYFPAGGDWDYAVLGLDGMVQQRGKLTFCARCHAEAPSGFVFVRR